MLVSLPTSHTLCDGPTLGNGQTLKIMNLKTVDIPITTNTQLRYMQNRNLIAT